VILKNKNDHYLSWWKWYRFATAKILQKRGARVFLCDINQKFIDKINKNIKNKNKIFAYVCDANNEKSVINFFKKVKKITNKIDCLINNVGISGPTGAIEKLDYKSWEETLKLM